MSFANRASIRLMSFFCARTTGPLGSDALQGDVTGLQFLTASRHRLDVETGAPRQHGVAAVAEPKRLEACIQAALLLVEGIEKSGQVWLIKAADQRRLLGIGLASFQLRGESVGVEPGFEAVGAEGPGDDGQSGQQGSNG